MTTEGRGPDPRRSDAIRAALKGYEPTDEQWRAISHPLEPLYLIAGAGSGKTAVMAARIAWALETQPFSPAHVLASPSLTRRPRSCRSGSASRSPECTTNPERT